MKTIEEINAIAPYDPYEWQQGYGIWQDGYMEGQKGGATEQKAIDIEKACEWIESHFRDIENPDFYSKRNHPTEVESMYHWSVKELVDDFRNAMEEEKI